MTVLDMAPPTTRRLLCTAGTIIFREGDPGDAMYIVLEGIINIFLGDTRIATVGPGGIIGELAVINTQPRSATARAETDCILTPITAQQFHAMMQDMPVLAQDMLDALSERLRRLTTRLEHQGRPLRPRVRLATAEDLPLLQPLVDQSIRILGAGDYNQQQIESALHYLIGSDTPQLIEDGTYYVVEVDGEIAACGGWSKRHALHGGESSHGTAAGHDLDPAQDAAKIRQFYVHPRWARRGLARKLLQTCEQAALAAGFTRLDLLATLTGEPLYAAFGFKQVGEVEITMPDGMTVTTVRMEKILARTAAA